MRRKLKKEDVKRALIDMHETNDLKGFVDSNDEAEKLIATLRSELRHNFTNGKVWAFDDLVKSPDALKDVLENTLVSLDFDHNEVSEIMNDVFDGSRPLEKYGESLRLNYETTFHEPIDAFVDYDFNQPTGMFAPESLETLAQDEAARVPGRGLAGVDYSRTSVEDPSVKERTVKDKTAHAQVDYIPKSDAELAREVDQNLDVLFGNGPKVKAKEVSVDDAQAIQDKKEAVAKVETKKKPVVQVREITDDGPEF